MYDTDVSDLVPLVDAAAELGVAPSTLRLQARLGRLRARKVARDWFVARPEIERYRRDHLRSR